MRIMRKNDLDSKRYEIFAQKTELVYQFISMQNEYSNQLRDYGTGEFLTMVEIHTLTSIEENPGITITKLAKLWRKTKSAISQMVSRLEKKGYIYREKYSEDSKQVLIYATEEGVKLSKAHKAYDNEDLRLTLDSLLEICSFDDVQTFFGVVSAYIEIMQAYEDQEKENQEKIKKKSK